MTSNTTQKNQKDLSGQWNWLVDDDNSTMIFPRKSLQGLKSFPLWNTRGYQTASVFRPSDISCVSKNWIFSIDNSFGTGWTLYKILEPEEKYPSRTSGSQMWCWRSNQQAKVKSLHWRHKLCHITKEIANHAMKTVALLANNLKKRNQRWRELEI